MEFLNKRNNRFVLFAAVGGIFLYFLISNIFPLRDRILSLFFQKDPTYAQSDIIDTEVLSNEIFVKVRADVNDKVKTASPKNTGIATLDKKNQVHNVKKIEKLARKGKNSKTEAGVFQWYKITLDKKEERVKAKFQKSKKALVTNDSKLVEVKKALDDYAQDENIIAVEPNYVITHTQVESQLPTAPGLLVATRRSSTSIQLDWGPATDNTGVGVYNIYRNNQLISQGNVLSFIDTNLTPSTTYTYYVKAQDIAGNVGPASNTVSSSTYSSDPPPTQLPADCVRANPTVVLSPTSKSANAGQIFTYTITVRNNDSASCPASEFEIIPVVPYGWTGQTGISISNVTPGKTSYPAALSYTSSTILPAGNYQIREKVQNRSDREFTATALVTAVINGVTPTLTPSSNPSATATPMPPTGGSSLSNDPYYSSTGSWGQTYKDLWGLEKINVANGWTQTTGSSSVIVADIDTGVDRNHPDLQSNMWVNSDEIASNGVDDDGNGYIDDYYGWDFHNNDTDPMDDDGHGTHTAGTIAGIGNNGIGVVGISWNAKIMALKFMGTGGGYTSNAIKAMVYAVDNGARISSNSWGCQCQSLLLEDALAYAHGKGMVIIAAAGNNNGDALDFSPASSDKAITVGASDVNDARSIYWNVGASNWGEKIDVVAPGSDILSTKASANACSGYTVGTIYCRQWGTSMAAPHVAGLAALMLAKNPNLSNEDVRQIIRNAAVDLGPAGKDRDFGYGRVDVGKTLTMIDNLRPQVVIASPLSRSSISSSFTVSGTAGGSEFASYKLEVGAGRTPSSWKTVTTATTPVIGGTLASVDASQYLAQGNNTFRLSVNGVDGKVYQYATYDVNYTPNVTETSTPTPPSNSLALTYPNGGESFKTGDKVRITWETAATGACSLYYFIGNNTTTAYSIGNVSNASIGSYDWLVSAPSQTVGTTYQMRVQLVCVGLPVEYSDNYFTVTVAQTPTTPTPTVTPTPPTAGCFNAPQLSLASSPTSTNSGQTFTNTLRVKNPNDPSCGSTAPLSITRSLPSGWVMSIPNTVSIPGGETAQVPFTVTVANSASSGDYNYQLWVASWGPVNGSVQVISSPSPTPTRVPTATSTPIPPTATRTPVPPTATVTVTPSNTPTSTPVPTVTPTPDLVPPIVSVTSPQNGTSVSEEVVISATATDTSGVSQVQFWIDGSVKATVTSQPFSYNWNSRDVDNGEHTISVNAVDTLGNSAVKDIVITVNNRDITPPAVPSGLRSRSVTHNQVVLQWNQSLENDIDGYWIIRNGVTVGQSSTVSFTDTTVTPQTAYSYQVVAYDTSDNNSQPSQAITVQTPDAPDTQSPTAPVNLSAIAVSQSQINLSWSASTDNIGVVDYEIWRNGTLLTTVSTTSMGDSNLVPSTRYTYYVVAKDAAGNRSTSSNTVSATTQSPPVVNGSISGTVTNDSGSAIRSAKITIVLNGILTTTYTNSAGLYEFKQVPPLTGYNVTYSAKKYNTYARLVNVANGESVTINVTLNSSTGSGGGGGGRNNKR